MNLKTEQNKYRVFLEEGASGNESEVWRYYELQGRRGKIWSYSRDMLAMLILSNRVGERIRREYPTWKLVQNGENEMCFILPNSELWEAAKIVRPKTKRRVSEKTLERLKGYRDRLGRK